MHLFEFLVSEFNRFFQRVAHAIESFVKIRGAIDAVLLSVPRETDATMSGFVIPSDGAILAVLRAGNEAKVVLLAVQFVAVNVVKLLTVLRIHYKAVKQKKFAFLRRDLMHSIDVAEDGEIPLEAGHAPEIFIINERVQVLLALNFYRFHPILLPEVQ
jgi:hypothetical protein